MQDIVSVYLPGHLDYCDSYGLIACELLRHLTALGTHVNLMALGKARHENQPADVAALVREPITPTLGGILLGWPTTYPAHSPLAHVGPRIAVTMFESSRIPPNWLEPLNALDAIVTPSKFCARIFKRCGVTTPIHVIPLGIGDIYQPYRRPLSKRLTFLTFLDRGRRKGGLDAQQAFSKAFGDSTDVHLIMKMRVPKVRLDLQNENMTLIQQDYTDAELYELYKQCDVLINPNMGEGFGLIPREFAATGGASLSTKWGGTADHINEWGWPLSYKLVKADWGHDAFKDFDLGKWAQPRIRSIAAMLRRVADNREFFLHNAMEQAEHVRSMYSWRKFAEGVLSVWKGVTGGNI